MNPTARAAWCIGHDRRLNHERRPHESAILIEGRADGARITGILEGQWKRVPGALRFSLRNRGCVVGVWRWQPGSVQ